MSDIEIARAASKIHIRDVAAKIDIPEESLVPYGHDIAKINFDFIEKSKSNPDGKLILVTAISPTPAGEGKTTTSVGLNDGLNAIGKKSIVCLREPSLGPNFGMKITCKMKINFFHWHYLRIATTSSPTFHTKIRTKAWLS